MTKHFFVKPFEFSEQISDLTDKGHGIILRYMIVADKKIADLINSYKRNSKDVFLACLVLQKLSQNNHRYNIEVFRNVNADCTDVDFDDFYAEFSEVSQFKSYRDFILNQYNLSMIERNSDYEAKSTDAFWFYWGAIPSNIHPSFRINISPKNIRALAEQNRIERFCQIAMKNVRIDDSISDEAGNILAELLAYTQFAQRLENLRGFTIHQYHRMIKQSQSMTLMAA